MTKALVLSGGSIRGAFQAGAIPEVVRSGFEPTAIYGTSVGALNGGFLVNAAGKAARKGREADWGQFAGALSDLWAHKIVTPASIGKRRSTLGLVGAVAINDFKGLMRTRALERTVRQAIKVRDIKNSPVRFSAGVVNLKSGEYLDIDQKNPKIVDYILASTRIPFIMPISTVNKEMFQDGGIKQVAPFRKAIKEGAEEIVAIVCQPVNIEIIDFKHKNLQRYAERIMTIVVNQLINADIKQINLINDFCPADGSPATSGPFKGKRRIECTIIRPHQAIDLDLNSFNADDIARVQAQGAAAARRVL